MAEGHNSEGREVGFKFDISTWLFIEIDFRSSFHDSDRYMCMKRANDVLIPEHSKCKPNPSSDSQHQLQLYLLHLKKSMDTRLQPYDEQERTKPAL